VRRQLGGRESSVTRDAGNRRSASLGAFAGGNRVRRSWLRQFLAGVLFVGAIAVYLASSGLGARLLHQEIETQLSRLLSGPVKIAEVELRFSGGLLLVARGLEAYPSPDPAGQPALRAARVSAWTICWPCSSVGSNSVR